MKKTEKRPNFLKLWLVDPFVALFYPFKFSWVEKEAEVLDKRFVKAHWEAYGFFFSFHQESIPAHWEILVKVNDDKIFWSFLSSEPTRNNNPCWISISGRKGAEKALKRSKVKVKCLVDNRGMIYKTRTKIAKNKK